MSLIQTLSKTYPWTTAPLLVAAPLRLISLAPLATTVSKAGGIGFLAAGTDASSLESQLSEAAKLLNHTPSPSNPLPIGIGFINWGSSLPVALSAVRKFTPAAIWLSFPRQLAELVDWADQIRETSQRKTQVWVQIGTVTQAVEIAKLCKPDVIVAQGADAGGHGLARGASIISLVPEIVDALRLEGHGEIPVLAAGGISDGRGVAAALALGASGAVMGTRFLVAREAEIKKGYQDDVLRTTDGGVTTVRTDVYDMLRGTTGWPAQYDGRGIANRSYDDAQNGLDVEENMRLYKEAEAKGDGGWGPEGRVTAYAGTGVGLIREVKGAAEIVEETRNEAKDVLEKTRELL